MSQVIEAAGRFGPHKRGKPSELEALRNTKRISLHDRALLAGRLGEVAAVLSPDRPGTIAKKWFDEAWAGDRWAKRKRLITFPREDAPNVGDEGAYVATGSDWAALIETAAKSFFPTSLQNVDAERSRMCRDLLRGTAFLPALDLVSLRAESAQSLISLYARKSIEAIIEQSDLTRLWNVLETTPFTIEMYDLERPDLKRYPIDSVAHARASAKKFEGDSYSNGPLGEAAKLAAAPAAMRRYEQSDQWGYRFEPISAVETIDWSYPCIRLGLRGHLRSGRIFVLPPHFIDDMPDDMVGKGVNPEDLAIEWLIKKGIISRAPYAALPEIPFDLVLGYGWKDFPHEVIEKIWIEIRPRVDGTPGLWISSDFPNLPYRYPRLTSFDALATEASSPDRWLCCLSLFAGHDTHYEFLGWPTHRADFMPNGGTPPGAVSGLIDLDYEDIPMVEGWIDDLENNELQHLLFSTSEDTRFCPSFPAEAEVPPPCREGAIAAAIFNNTSCDSASQIGQVLLEQAKTISSTGLAFHDVLLKHHRSLIESMFAS